MGSVHSILVHSNTQRAVSSGEAKERLRPRRHVQAAASVPLGVRRRREVLQAGVEAHERQSASPPRPCGPSGMLATGAS